MTLAEEWADVYEFQASLVYTVNSKPSIAKQHVPGLSWLNGEL